MSTYNKNAGYGQLEAIALETGSLAGRLTPGKTLICMKSTDTDNYARLKEIFDVDNDGTVRFFSSIVEAVAVAQDWDKIIIGPGDWDEGEVIAITQQGLKLIGPGIGNQHTAMILGADAAHHLITVNAHNVEIAGLGFTQTNDTYSAIMCSTTDSYHKTHIHDCRFDGYGAGEYAIHTGTTYDTPDIVIENNRFHSWQTAAIYFYATRGLCRKNIIVTVAAKIGIDCPHTDSRGNSFVVDNDILGVNSTDVGIATAAADAGVLFVARNHISGCATSIETWANGQYGGTENYASSTAGGTLIDIDT
jgi:hypothetical protein